MLLFLCFCVKMKLGDFMKCPNCHGDIEESLVTCPMCGHILENNSLDVNLNLNDVSCLLSAIRQNILFILKVFILSSIIIDVSFTLISSILSDNNFNIDNILFPVMTLIIAIFLLIMVIKRKKL